MSLNMTFFFWSSSLINAEGSGEEDEAGTMDAKPKSVQNPGTFNWNNANPSQGKSTSQPVNRFINPGGILNPINGILDHIRGKACPAKANVCKKWDRKW